MCETKKEYEDKIEELELERDDLNSRITLLQQELNTTVLPDDTEESE